MPSLLNLLAPAFTTGARAKSAQLTGEAEGAALQRKTLLEDLAMQQQAEDRQSQTLMQELQRRNIESQIADRERPPMAAPQRPIYDASRGVMVDPEGATATPVQGLPPKLTEPKPSYEERSEGGGTAIYEGGQFSKWKIPPPQTAPTRAQLPTEGERKAAAFYASGKKGYETLEAMLGDDPSTPQVEKGRPVPGFWAQQAAKVGFGAGNVMTNNQVRQMRQAALMLSDAWLRYTSGAAVPEQEVERFAESFIPRAGDDEGTLQQKKEARATIIEALRKGAGRALNSNVVGQQPGPGDDLDAQIDAVLGRRP